MDQLRKLITVPTKEKLTYILTKSFSFFTSNKYNQKHKSIQTNTHT